MSLQEWLAAREDRCALGFAEIQHPRFCTCTHFQSDEWTQFVAALRKAARADGLIHQGDVRPLIQKIPHKHRGLLYRKARTEGLIEVVGKEPSTDTAGRNGDKDSRVYRWAA